VAPITTDGTLVMLSIVLDEVRRSIERFRDRLDRFRQTVSRKS
jgi:hypothetical protein